MQEKNMIFLKKKHVIPKQGGGGGGPPLGKNSHIFPFFFLGSFPNGNNEEAILLQLVVARIMMGINNRFSSMRVRGRYREVMSEIVIISLWTFSTSTHRFQVQKGRSSQPRCLRVNE